MGLIGKGVGKSAQEKASNRILSQITDQDYTPVQVTNLLFGHNKFSPSQAVPLALSKLRNTNKLLFRNKSVTGFKTGVTRNAGPCLASSMKMEKGIEILVVTLDSSSRQSRWT